MKRGFRFIIICLYLGGGTNCLKSQVVSVNQLKALLSKSEKDSVMLMERYTAACFHRLLNEYRKEKGLDTLNWSEELWLATRNHNIWMSLHNTLSHTQKEGTAGFSGKNPGDRYAYATLQKGSFSWSGENALYNYSAHGRNIAEIAMRVAESSLEQWKRSPGHNQNMLGKSHGSHGTSFIFKNSQVWATSLFSYQCRTENDNNISVQVPISLKRKENTRQENKSTSSVNKPKLPTRRHLTEMLKSELKEDFTDKAGKAFTSDPYLDKAAQKHADYMMRTKLVSITEHKSAKSFYGKNSRMRLLKASSGRSLFSFRKTKLIEQVAMADVDEKNWEPEMLIEELKIKLSEGTPEKDKGSIGIGVAVQKQKHTHVIYVSRLLALK